jgi:hypothetical protein
MTVPHSDCFCDNCMIKYFNQGLIPEGTPAYDEAKQLVNHKRAKVISGFPAIGKSFLFNNENNSIVLDSDSSMFSWVSEGVRSTDFPNNYMKHIEENLSEADYIFVSSHDVVRNALKNYHIAYTIVYPSIELKDEYLQRYKDRGNNEKFISFIESNWDNFINDIEKEWYPRKIKLESGQYLSDVLEKL